MKPLVYRKAKRVRHKAPVRQKLHITKGDTVQVISGDDKGKQGKVLEVFPKTGRIKVQGVNIVTRHLRASPTTEGGKVTRRRRSITPRRC
jgi:large subunit ribosomal protein L24